MAGLIVILCILAIVLIVAWGVFRVETSTTKYKEAMVMQKEETDSCDVVSKGRFYIEYTRYFLGFIPYTAKFETEHCLYGDCYWKIEYAHSVRDIINAFNTEAGAVIKKKENVKIQDVPPINCDDD